MSFCNYLLLNFLLLAVKNNPATSLSQDEGGEGAYRFYFDLPFQFYLITLLAISILVSFSSFYLEKILIGVFVRTNNFNFSYFLFFFFQYEF